MESPEKQGIIPRIINDIFNHIFNLVNFIYLVYKFILYF